MPRFASRKLQFECLACDCGVQRGQWMWDQNMSEKGLLFLQKNDTGSGIIITLHRIEAFAIITCHRWILGFYFFNFILLLFLHSAEHNRTIGRQGKYNSVDHLVKKRLLLDVPLIPIPNLFESEFISLSNPRSTSRPQRKSPPLAEG
jgi:hypothetical protein